MHLYKKAGIKCLKRIFGYFLGASKKLHAQQGGIKADEYKAFEWNLGGLGQKEKG